MARRLPRPLARREFLYGPNVPADTLTGMAQSYYEHGMMSDATVFYARAEDETGLKKMHDFAMNEGDAFIMRKVQEAMPHLVSDADWKTLGDNARELGKETYGERADNGGTPPPPPLQEELKLESAEDAENGENSERNETSETQGA